MVYDVFRAGVITAFVFHDYIKQSEALYNALDTSAYSNQVSWPKRKGRVLPSYSKAYCFVFGDIFFPGPAGRQSNGTRQQDALRRRPPATSIGSHHDRLVLAKARLLLPRTGDDAIICTTTVLSEPIRLLPRPIVIAWCALLTQQQQPQQQQTQQQQQLQQ